MAIQPPVVLGAIIFSSFAVALGLRAPAVKAVVLAASGEHRPARQFFLDFGLVLVAAVLAAVCNVLYNGFPLASGMLLIFGCTIAGFFIAVDMALDRERRGISEALERPSELGPPERLFPMTRKFLLVAGFAALFTGSVLVLMIVRDLSWLVAVGGDPEEIRRAGMSVAYEIFFVVGVLLVMVFNLIISYSRNLKLLFANQTDVLEYVSRGDLSRKVPVVTKDEFGVIAGHTNSMIDALRHRLRLISALKVAEEVQANLLPKAPPQVPGLDVAGRSLYSEETGGDYFDFFPLPGGQLGVAVGDVTGHGVGAALLMASARAYLRSEGREAASLGDCVRSLNLNLHADIAETGRFMTLFLLAVDPEGLAFRWVRAGHDPGLLYTPADGAFEVLMGDGMALGVLGESRYEEVRRENVPSGAVLVVGTDGIWEAHTPEKGMFGRERFQEVVRRNAHRSAAEIIDAVVGELETFLEGTPPQDDVTLVVLKFS